MMKLSRRHRPASELLVCRHHSAAKPGHRRGGLGEHGGWGSGSAPVAARIIEAFVDKQRRLDNNLQEAKVPSKVEVGAVGQSSPRRAPTREGHTVATRILIRPYMADILRCRCSDQA